MPRVHKVNVRFCPMVCGICKRRQGLVAYTIGGKVIRLKNDCFAVHMITGFVNPFRFVAVHIDSIQVTGLLFFSGSVVESLQIRYQRQRSGCQCFSRRSLSGRVNQRIVPRYQNSV